MTTTRRIISGLSVAATLAAAAGPASAGQFNVNSHGSYVQIPPASAPARQLASRDDASPTVVRVTNRSGFAWGDAGIGAAGGVAIAVLIAGGMTAGSERRQRGGIRHA